VGPSAELDNVERRKILILPGLELPRPSRPYPVAIPTTLSRCDWFSDNLMTLFHLHRLQTAKADVKNMMRMYGFGWGWYWQI
jgi:hypothetical protein